MCTSLSSRSALRILSQWANPILQPLRYIERAMADAAPPQALPPGTDDDKSWVAIFTVVLCLTVSTLMVGLRIYTRKAITKQMGVDDWAAIITLVCFLSPGPHHQAVGRGPVSSKRVLIRPQLVTYADGITIATCRE